MPDKITEEKLEKYFYEADKHKELLLETTDLLEKSFFDILKEIEKEGVIDIDSWDELRKLRINIAHEYPQEEEAHSHP